MSIYSKSPWKANDHGQLTICEAALSAMVPCTTNDMLNVVICSNGGKESINIETQRRK